MIGLLLMIWAGGCGIYSVYAFANFRGDGRGETGPLLLGAGGMLFLFGPDLLSIPALLMLVVGKLYVFGVTGADAAPLPGAALDGLPEDAPASPEPEASPVFGGMILLAGLAILFEASYGFWLEALVLAMTVIPPDAVYSADPGSFLFNAVRAAAGASVFYMGFVKSGLSRESAATRACAVGFAGLVFCAFPVAVAYNTAHQKLSKNPAQAAATAVSEAPAPPKPATAPLIRVASADGAVAMQLPACWKAVPAPGTLFHAVCGGAEISLADAGNPAVLDVLLLRANQAEAAARAAGAQTDGSAKSTLLEGNAPLASVRWTDAAGRRWRAEFSLRTRSFSLTAKDLSDADQKAVENALDAFAAGR